MRIQTNGDPVTWEHGDQGMWGHPGTKDMGAHRDLEAQGPRDPKRGPGDLGTQ